MTPRSWALGRALVATAALSAACHHHLERNAPGAIDVYRPPEHLAIEAVERPQDPGERMVLVAPGVLSGLGAGFGDRGTRLVGDLALEVSVIAGTSPHSHAADSLFGGFLVPSQAWAANFGAAFAETERRDSRMRWGHLYVELERQETLMGGAIGWDVDVTDAARHGPRAMTFIGPFYLRARHDFGVADTQVTFGMIFKMHAGWIWSR